MTCGLGNRRSILLSYGRLVQYSLYNRLSLYVKRLRGADFTCAVAWDTESWF